MSRRSKEWAWLPDKVYYKKGRYVIASSFKPYREHFLAAGNASKSQVWQAYDHWMSKGTDTLSSLTDAYLESEKFKTLKPATQESYQRLLNQLMNWEMPRYKLPFGTLRFDEVANTTIQSAYDQQEANIARNRRFTVLKAVYSWGMQRIPLIKKNPVIGLEMLPEPPRNRYVSDAEYDFIYALASPTLQLMMEAAYLLRLRRKEISNLRRMDSILEHGVLVERTKGSWDGVVSWSPRLRKFVRDCKLHNGDRVSPYLIHNSSGGGVTKSALDSMWRRIWAKAKEVENCPIHFTFHDLKAKGITDHPDKEGGHKSPKMREVYDRENRLEKPTK